MDEEIRQQLEEMTGALKAVGERQVALEDRIKAVEDRPETARAETPLTDSSPDTAVPADLSELQAENATLKERVSELTSEEHYRAVLQEWLRGITPEGYIRLGVNLGYSDLLADPGVVDDPDALHEVALNDVPGQPKVLFSETLPPGEDGWEKSETLGCYVKVENTA